MALSKKSQTAIIRIAIASLFALAFASGVYALLNALRPEAGLISFSFLLFLPATISAFVAYVGDPLNHRGARYYRLVPIWLVLAAIALSVIILREGTVCAIILAPIWALFGLLGAEATYRIRRRHRHADPDETADIFRASALLALPLLMMQVEPMIPLPVSTPNVERSILIHATPDRIWPMLEGIPNVRPGEGRFNFTQDIVGVPRPLGARLVGQGVGANRLAQWTHNIGFRERITDWQPGQRLGWRFIFDDSRGWDFTDPHLRPDSSYFQILDGGYRMERVAPGLTRLTLTTRYRMRTPVNLYCQLWGEVFLGDLHNNLLSLIKARAENQPLASRG